MYYIYAWVIKDTQEVFYIGRGHGDRYRTLKNRSKYFHEFYDNYECEPIILLSGLTEKESIEEERLEIAYYRSLGMAKANIHNGGEFGGDVVSNMPEIERQGFIDKITKINRERCRSDEFRRKTGERMKRRYSDPNERIIQSEKVKAFWTEGERLKQSERIKQSYRDNPEFRERRARSHYKKCILEIDGKVIEFESLKSLEQFLKDEYHLTISREKEQDMLYHRTPYKTSRSRLKHLNGFKMYYVM